MSVWRVATTDQASPALAGHPSRSMAFVDGIVKWIPSELVLLYAAIVTIYGAHSVRLLATMVLLGPFVVLILRSRSQGRLSINALASAAVVALSTAVWTLVIPDAGWSSVSFVDRNGPLVAAVALVAGLILAGVASVVDTRFAARFSDTHATCDPDNDEERQSPRLDLDELHD